MKTLIIDNYDSYTYNIYHIIWELTGEKPYLIKNDEMKIDEVKNLDFDNIIISSGSGTYKNDFGISAKLFDEFDCPILALGVMTTILYNKNGGNIINSPSAFAKESQLSFKDDKIFTGIENNSKIVRYHCLACEDKELKDIEIIAWAEDGHVMAIKDKNKNHYCLQFQLDSVCTENSYILLRNFLKLSSTGKEFLYYRVEKGSFDTEKLFYSLKEDDKNLMWLDSSKIVEGLSRYSILATASDKRGHFIKYSINDKLIVEKFNGEVEEFENIDIFSYLRENMNFVEAIRDLEFDFQLGYVGYLGYELKELSGYQSIHKSNLPDAYLMYSDRALVYDHLEDKLYILSYSDDLDWQEEILEKINSDKKSKIASFEEKAYPRFYFEKSKDEYIDDINKCQELIKNSQAYGICLTTKLIIEDKIDANSYYKILRKLSPAPYTALINFKDVSLASSSMERFIKLDRDKLVESKPIKGTVRRGLNEEEDQRLIDGLKNNRKTREENIMVIDSLRGDLSKVCQAGTVEVSKFLDVETYTTLHQLVTSIQGRLDDEKDLFDLIEALIPGGSMTGVPKEKSLEILESLEKSARGPYSGSIGYISNCKTLDLNIIIRTAVIEKDKASIGVGGAIIDGSVAEDEFQEILLKAKGALGAFMEYYKGNLDEEIPIENSGEM